MHVYIHELSNWPHFSWDHEAIVRPLGETRHQQGLLIGRMREIGFPLQEEAVLQSLSQEIVSSSAIEGERLDWDQVRSSLARRLGIDIGGLLPADRHVDGIVELMLDATQRFKDPLTAERLFGWQAALFPTGRSGLSEIRVGTWRTGSMQVVSGPFGKERVHFEAPEAERVTSEMDGFLAWFNGGDDTDPVLRAALSHLWFVTIHPFDDGNGRIARAVADMALTRSEGSPHRFYSVSAQIQTERESYYRVLERTQKGTLDVTEWLLWFLDCLKRAFERAEGTLLNVLRKAHFWREHAGVSFNDRQRKLLNRLLEGFEGKLTSSKWAKIAKCSQVTAIRDIHDLVDQGVLRQDSAGGRSTSYSLVT